MGVCGAIRELLLVDEDDGGRANSGASRKAGMENCAYGGRIIVHRTRFTPCREWHRLNCRQKPSTQGQSGGKPAVS